MCWVISYIFLTSALIGHDYSVQTLVLLISKGLASSDILRWLPFVHEYELLKYFAFSQDTGEQKKSFL